MMMAVRVKKAVKLGSAAALVVVVMIGARWCYRHTRGVEVRVHNVDQQPLHSVVVLVTGRQYEIGDLAPGATDAVFVKPTSESGVAFSLVDRDGHQVHLNAGGYFEPGNTGAISVDINAHGARRVEQDIQLY